MVKENQVQLCGYSYHTEPFRQTYRNGADAYIFRLQTEGSSRLTVDGTTMNLEPGDLTLITPGDVFELQIRIPDLTEPEGLTNSGDYFVFCDGPWVREWWRRKTRPRKSRIVGDTRLLGLWTQLNLEKQRLDGGDPELIVTLLQSLCLMLDRALEEAPVPGQRISYLAVRMKHYVEENALRQLKLEHVAEHIGLSVSRTVHLFKEHYGVSIMQYVHKIRLASAKELMLCSPMTLDQIAEAAGFGGYPYFHRVFKEHYGVSPGVYRKNQGILHEYE
jgi:AraC family transcriptional regulator, arabinose operon regulatory protein